MKSAIAITISGSVQGVYYRASTKAVADRLGVAGFVRNEPNGEVYIEAEGSGEALSKLVEWCHQGPSLAKVSSVTQVAIPVQGFNAFTVNR